jgi:hypothetical protein
MRSACSLRNRAYLVLGSVLVLTSSASLAQTPSAPVAHPKPRRQTILRSQNCNVTLDTNQGIWRGHVTRIAHDAGHLLDRRSV